MSVFNTTPINSSFIKVRWQEPYTSASLNNKTFGVYPPGCYNGFVIGPGGLSGRDIIITGGSVSGNVGNGMNSGYVSGNYDATVGYLTAVLQDPGGFQTTVQIPPTAPVFHLDATGLDGQRIFIVITVEYTIGNQSTAEISLVNSGFIDANPFCVVVGYVDVPVSPGTPLSSPNFGYFDPTYPRISPLSNPNKAGLMPALAWVISDPNTTGRMPAAVWQLIYAGVPAWSATINYQLGYFASDGAGNLYSSIVNNNLNHILTDTTKWQKVIGPTFVGIGQNGESAVSGNYTVLPTDNGKIFLCDSSIAGFGITFPTPVKDFKFTVADAKGFFGVNPVTMTRIGSEQVQGLAANFLLEANWGAWTFITDGTNWFEAV